MSIGNGFVIRELKNAWMHGVGNLGEGPKFLYQGHEFYSKQKNINFDPDTCHRGESQYRKNVLNKAERAHYAKTDLNKMFGAMH